MNTTTRKPLKRKKPLPEPEMPRHRATRSVYANVLWLGNGHMSEYKKFGETFGRELKEFWIDNTKGLDLERFNREVVGAADIRGLLTAVYAEWGDNGVRLVKRLIPKGTKLRSR